MAIPTGKRTGNSQIFGVSSILFPDESMWGSTQSFGAAELKRMLLLGMNLNDAFLMFYASPVLGIHGSLSRPVGYHIMIIMNCRPKKEGEGHIMQLAMGKPDMKIMKRPTNCAHLLHCTIHSFGALPFEPTFKFLSG